MTVTVTRPLARPHVGSAGQPGHPAGEESHVVLDDPRPGTILELAPGTRLTVRFRRGLGPSRWHVTGLPGHLLVLGETGHELHLLVFGGGDSSEPLRVERRHPEREIAHEVCELLVVPVSERVRVPARRAARRAAAVRTSRSASPRTA